MPGKNRPSRKPKLEIEGSITFASRSDSESLIVDESEKSIQVCIKKGEITANPWLPKGKVNWTDAGLEMPVWLAARITKSDAVFEEQGEQAGREAIKGWNIVKAKTARLRHAMKGEGHNVSVVAIISPW